MGFLPDNYEDDPLPPETIQAIREAREREVAARKKAQEPDGLTSDGSPLPTF